MSQRDSALQSLLEAASPLILSTRHKGSALLGDSQDSPTTSPFTLTNTIYFLYEDAVF
jgi:hypothetical protein